MSDSETPQDISQQVTAKTPATRVKDPKKVAAGKALQQKNREAREAQKKFLESQQKELVEAKTKTEELESAKAADTPPADTPPADTPSTEPAKNVLTTTQWLSVISIVVSLAGIYYKREEIKGLLTPKKPQVYTPPPVPPNSTVVRKGGIKPMD